MKLTAFILSFFLVATILYPTVLQERVEQETEEVSVSIIVSQQREVRLNLVVKSTPCTRQIPINDSILFDSKKSIHLSTPLYLRHRILLI